MSRPELRRPYSARRIAFHTESVQEHAERSDKAGPRTLVRPMASRDLRANSNEACRAGSGVGGEAGAGRGANGDGCLAGAGERARMAWEQSHSVIPCSGTTGRDPDWKRSGWGTSRLTVPCARTRWEEDGRAAAKKCGRREAHLPALKERYCLESVPSSGIRRQWTFGSTPRLWPRAVLFC